VPVLFLIVSTWLIIETIRSNPARSGIGLFLILLGVPVYWIIQSRQKRVPLATPEVEVVKD
jgi:hypothetical protein